MLVEIAIIGGAILAGAAGLQHFYDRYHPRGLYLRTVRRGDEVQAELSGVREALVRLPAEVGVAVGAAITQVQKDFGEEMAKALPQPVSELVPQNLGLALGPDAQALKQLTKSLKSAIGTDMLGPYGAILQEWAPNVYAWLSEHPESVQWALEQPFVQSIINRVAKMVPGRTDSATWNTATSSSWGT